MQTILWIHGFPLAAEVFEKQRTIAGVRHIMPDLPGFGSAAPSAGVSAMDDYARFAVRQLDAAGVEKAVFAGLSMGGYICFSIMRLYPERVAGLILIDTRETADSVEARKGRLDSIEKVRVDGVKPVVQSMLPKMLTAAAPDSLKEQTRKMMLSSSQAGVMAALRAMADRSDSSPLLSSIRVPTLIVAGKEDTIVPPADARRMSESIRGSRLVILPRAAHLSNLEQPKAFNSAVREFLDA